MKKNRGQCKNPGDHNPSECSHTIHGQYIHYKPESSKDGKEIVQIRSQEIRDLIVPKTEFLEVPGIMSKSEFQRLKRQAYFVTPAERKALKEEADKKKEQLVNESRQRRENLKKAQLEQNAAKGSVLEDAESDAAKKNQYLLQRAYELQQEQEDEIKGLNGIILASKCLAIREAQIVEKKVIQRELDEEEQRLDMMMEQRRQQGLEEERHKRELEHERNQTFVQQIKQQLKENEIQRLLEAERKDEEARKMNKALIAMQEEEKQKLTNKLLKQKQARDELKLANDDLEKYRELQKEEERLADARLKEFLRKKAERDAVLEAEAKEIKDAKEKEIARLRASQEKAADLQSQRDEINAYRMHEEAEREWRRKEKEAALKKKEMMDNLKKDREKQIEDIRKAQALEIIRDKEEFHKVARLQYEAYLKEQQKLKDKREKAAKHKTEILQQVDEKERERIELRKAKMEEGHAIRVEKEIREMKIQETVDKKIAGLRSHSVPEQNLMDIQRQVHTKIAKMRMK